MTTPTSLGPSTPAFRGVDGAVYVANQFGPDTFAVVARQTELCVPATVTTQKAVKKKRR